MRALLSGGGTGGHINPALSIAKRILTESPGSEVAFVGTPKGMENRLVKKEGFKLYHVSVMGFKRKLDLRNIKAAYYAVTSVYKAKKIIKEFKPDIVIGTGGYVSWPVLKAAAQMNIPTLIHEQNAVPGVTTKLLSKYVDKVAISFEESREYFDKKEKLFLAGNPINPEIVTKDKNVERARLNKTKPYVLSYGGSLGARRINEVVYEVIKNFSIKNGIQHTHAFGSSHWQQWKENIEKDGLDKYENIEFLEYIYDMPSKMSACDVVICRAGALTLAELAALNKPAILIPSPYVANNHQYKNALVYKNANAAFIIEEKDLTPETLSEKLEELLFDSDKRRMMEKSVKQFEILNADKIIYEEIVGLLKDGRNKT